MQFAGFRLTKFGRSLVENLQLFAGATGRFWPLAAAGQVVTEGPLLVKAVADTLCFISVVAMQGHEARL